MHSVRYPEILAGIAAIALCASPAMAVTVEAEDTASILYLDVSTGLDYYDNYESLADPFGTTTLWGTDIVLGFESETRSNTFSFRTGGRFEYGDFAEDPDRSSQWINPFATMNYQRDGKGSFFRTRLNYQERDNGIDLDKEIDSSTDLIVDKGTRSDARAELEWAVGLDAPISAKVDLAYHQRRFFDTTDPDLTNQNTFSFEGELGFALTRTSTLLLVAGYQDRDDIEDLKDDEVISSIGIGLESQISPDLELRAVISYERDEVTAPISQGREVTVDEAPTIDLSLVKDLQNGNLRFTLLSELDSNGTRTTAQVGRNLELRRGELDFALGTTWMADGEITPVGSLKWERDYRTRQLSLEFNSSVYTNDDSDDILRNRMRFRFDQELTSQDGLRLEANLAASDDLEDGSSDYRQASASISWFRSINRDLSLVTGYRHAFYDDNEENGAVTENHLFARIDKRFSLRP